jgi:carboxyvinyl-carboxyphosphonate phosphorylmutase
MTDPASSPTSRPAPRAAFRALLQGEGCVHPASVFDAVSARLAEDIGYESGILGGSVASAWVLGAPDLIVLTLTELAEQVRRITRASALPLLVDADHGFGNALSVMRTVQELEGAGAAALTIEDTLLPTPYGAPQPQLVGLAEATGKVAAALAARRDPALCIVARCGALGMSSLEDALARVKAYAAAGPDALFFTGVTAREQLVALRAVTDLPFILGGSKGVIEDLPGLGVRLALQGHHVHAAAIAAMQEVLRRLRDGGAPPKADGALLATALRQPAYDAAAARFLGL